MPHRLLPWSSLYRLDTFRRPEFRSLYAKLDLPRLVCAISLAIVLRTVSYASVPERSTFAVDGVAGKANEADVTEHSDSSLLATDVLGAGGSRRLLEAYPVKATTAAASGSVTAR